MIQVSIIALAKFLILTESRSLWPIYTRWLIVALISSAYIVQENKTFLRDNRDWFVPGVDVLYPYLQNVNFILPWYLWEEDTEIEFHLLLCIIFKTIYIPKVKQRKTSAFPNMNFCIELRTRNDISIIEKITKYVHLIFCLKYELLFD